MTDAPEQINVRFGAVIRQKRVQLGLSQEAVGKQVGVSFQQIQKYERGTNRVALPMLVELAAALDTSVFALLSDALGETPSAEATPDDRQTLEFMKRLASLAPRHRRGVQLLVANLAEAV